MCPSPIPNGMITEELQRLCGLGPTSEEPEEQGPYISVEQLTGKFGALYEKVRSFVDYKDYHLIRRGAIRRMLKRQLYIERKPNSGAALLRELVSSGYLPNNKVPEAKALVLQSIIRKWMTLEREGLSISLSLDFASIDIEQFLFPDPYRDALVSSFFTSAQKSITYQGKETINHTLITFAACRRSFLSEDKPSLLHALITREIPELLSHSYTDPALSMLAPRLLGSLRTAEVVATHTLVWKVSSRLRNHALFYSVLLEVLHSYGKGSEMILCDEEKLKETTETIIETKQRQQKKLLRVSGRRAVIYLLLTKIVLGVAFEWPYERFILGSENFLALGTNALFHPLLLLTMITFVGKEHRGVQRVIDGVSAVVQGKEMKHIFIKPPANATTFFLVMCFYAVLFVVSFGVILSALIALHFNIVSIILFFVFLTLVSYFGLRIRGSARRWEPVREKPGTLGMVWNLFTFPIVNTGRWFSVRFSSVNIFVFFMDFLVEVPFKAFLGIFDASLSFIKEHRVDTY